MQALTILVFVVAPALALFLGPTRAFSVFCVALFCYPQAATMQIASLDFTSNRVAILAVYANIFLFHRELLRTFKWNWLDTFMVLYLVNRLIALSQNVSPDWYLVAESGNTLMDLVMPYFAVRLAIRDRSDLFTVLKTLLLIAIPLALLGAYECKTGSSPVDQLVGYYDREMRRGLYRASGTFGVHILFGLFFAGLAPICLGLWKQRVLSHRVLLVIFGFLLVGLISSMSSAPNFSLIISFVFLACYPYRRFWPALAIFGFFCIFFVEVYSNRHFYEVGIRFAFDAATANYRIDLINECFGGGMTGHWLAGFGYVGIGPGCDNTNFHWNHIDLVNIYISKLAQVGLLGALPYLAINILYFRRLWQAGKGARNPADLWLIWSITGTLIGWNVAMMTVSAFQQIEIFVYLLTAVSCNLPRIVLQLAPAPTVSHRVEAWPSRKRPSWAFTRTRCSISP